MELIIGETYSFYALANLRGLENYSTVINTIGALKGSSFETFRKTEATLKAMSEYSQMNNPSVIPMSSYKETKTVSENINENKVSLQLIRLLGKVSIEVTNATGKDIAINKVTMGKFRTTGNIYLLPYDATEKDPDNGNLLIKKGEESKLLTPTFPEGESNGSNWEYQESVNIPKETENNKNKHTFDFYINETDQVTVDPNGGDMKIALEVTGVDKDSDPKSTNFFFIRRNDLLKIPVLISNAETTVKFEQMHMPIGGLPTIYKFKEDVEISERTFVTDHAGVVKISYSLDKLNTSSTGWNLKYYDTEVKTGEHFCYAALLTNNTPNVPFILEPEEREKDPLNWWKSAGNNESDKPQCAFKMTAEDETGTTSSTKGYFTITLQELTNAASATIKLNLVAEKDGTEVVLPYTLTITNKVQTQEEGEY